jgi:hypothetical protein
MMTMISTSIRTVVGCKPKAASNSCLQSSPNRSPSSKIRATWSLSKISWPVLPQTTTVFDPNRGKRNGKHPWYSEAWQQSLILRSGSISSRLRSARSAEVVTLDKLRLVEQAVLILTLLARCTTLNSQVSGRMSGMIASLETHEQAINCFPGCITISGASKGVMSSPSTSWWCLIIWKATITTLVSQFRPLRRVRLPKMRRKSCLITKTTILNNLVTTLPMRDERKLLNCWWAESPRLM